MSNFTNQTGNRTTNIDFFKGVLIILVISGHVLQGKMDESILRTLIYSFHMPLFIGISGFLFNEEKVSRFSFIELVNKYWLRVIMPWIIAVIIYYILFGIQHNYTILRFIKSLIHPFYHLWYIPGFISWIVLTWCLKKLKLNNSVILLIALLISVISEILKCYPEIYKNYGIINSGIELILYTFRPYFYFFFVFGLLFKHLELKKPTMPEYIFPLLFFASVIFLFYNPNTVISVLNFFLFNSFLLSLILKISVNNLIPDNKNIEWIGINSLGIYLYHVIPILVCKSLIGIQNLVFFYTTVILLELVFIVAYIYISKIDFMRKYAFGLPEKK